MITQKTAEISRTYGAHEQRKDAEANEDSCTLAPAFPRRRDLGPSDALAGFGEHTTRQAVDHGGITPRGDRDQRHTLCREEAVDNEEMPRSRHGRAAGGVGALRAVP